MKRFKLVEFQMIACLNGRHAIYLRTCTIAVPLFPLFPLFQLESNGIPTDHPPTFTTQLKPTMLPFLPLLLLAAFTSARQWRSLDDSQLPLIAQMAPSPWQDVTSGHLGRMLIPRVAGTENK